jgi:hypothetical protein
MEVMFLYLIPLGCFISPEMFVLGLMRDNNIMKMYENSIIYKWKNAVHLTDRPVITNKPYSTC